MLYLKTLGGLSLHRGPATDGEAVLANSKSLLVLAILATSPDRSARRDHLAELLWPGTDRSRALRALRQALFFLRRFAADALESDDEVVRIRSGALDVDLWRFAQALEQQRWSDAIALYGGSFATGLERKGGVELEHLIEAEESRIRAGVEAAYGKAVTAALHGGNVGTATGLARGFVRFSPLDETAQRLLVRALRAAGDDVGAVQAFEAYRSLLEGLLEEQPDRGFREAIDRVRCELIEQPPAVAVAEPPGPPQDQGLPAPADRWTTVVRQAVRLPPTARWAILGVLVIAIAAVMGLDLLSGPGGASERLLADVRQRLLASIEGQEPGALAEVAVDRGTVRIRTVDDAPAGWLPSPDGERAALVVQAVDGWNLAVSPARGEPRVLTTEPGDEFPLAWSPDGRFLLFTRRRLLTDGRTEVFTYGMADVTLDSVRTFTRLQSLERPVARWSPDGSQIALTADESGVPNIFLVDFDGRDVRDLTLHRAWDGEPAWSPDGDRVAFVSRRDGGVPHLYVVRRDGSDLLRITRTGTEERSPLWLSPGAIAYVASGDVWVTELAGRTQVRLTKRGDVRTLVVVLGGAGGWIDAIDIGRSLPHTVSPGQFVLLTAEATDPQAGPMPLQMRPLRWLIEEPALARIEEPAWLQVVGVGTIRVVADLAGWRADTVTLVSLPLVVEPLAPVFVEDWRDGLRAERWRAFGTPTPYVNTTGAPNGGGVFVNNGDEYFASGAVSVAPFDLSGGFVVEFDARLRFTRKLHQEFLVALLGQDLPDSTLEAGRAPSFVEFRAVGPAGSRRDTTTLTVDGEREEIPLPSGAGLWHRYALQVHADGAVDLLVDDRMYWRSAAKVALARRGPAYLLLGAQSFQTELAHGPIRVYQGTKFRLPTLTDAQP